MRKFIYGLVGLSLLLLNSCEKNNCQTSLTASWVVAQHPPYANGAMTDSIRFYKADSMYTRYRLSASDTVVHLSYNSFFITENCREVDFVADISIGGNPASKFDILFLDTHRFDLRSQQNRGCDSCIISLRK